MLPLLYFVKTDKKGKTPAKFFIPRPEMRLATEKLDYLRSTKFRGIKIQHIHPDKKITGLIIAENEWDDLIPIAKKKVKPKKESKNQSNFQTFLVGVVTARDEWVYDSIKKTREKS